MIQTLTFETRDILYGNGTREVITTTPQQWSARLRRKGYKKTLLKVDKCTSITIKIKTK